MCVWGGGIQFPYASRMTLQSRHLNFELKIKKSQVKFSLKTVAELLQVFHTLLNLVCHFHELPPIYLVAAVRKPVSNFKLYAMV